MNIEKLIQNRMMEISNEAYLVHELSAHRDDLAGHCFGRFN